MLHSGRFKAVLDACVLYPAPLRDYLLSLAATGLYKPLWSEIIQDEWIRNLLQNRADLTKERLLRTVRLMNKAFPDAEVTSFHEIIKSLSLPDKNDNHVLAVGIRSHADVIITFNLNDFPDDYLLNYEIEAQHPDYFILNLIDLDKTKAVDALKRQVKRLTNPKRTVKEVLDTLESNGLEKSTEKVRGILGYM